MIDFFPKSHFVPMISTISHSVIGHLAQGELTKPYMYNWFREMQLGAENILIEQKLIEPKAFFFCDKKTIEGGLIFGPKYKNIETNFFIMLHLKLMAQCLGLSDTMEFIKLLSVATSPYAISYVGEEKNGCFPLSSEKEQLTKGALFVWLEHSDQQGYAQIIDFALHPNKDVCFKKRYATMHYKAVENDAKKCFNPCGEEREMMSVEECDVHTFVQDA